QALFRRLSVFAGGFTLEAAEAVVIAVGELGVDVLEGVAALADANLLTVGAGTRGDAAPGRRLGMLETIREFAFEQLAASGDDEATRIAHAAYVLCLAERAEAAVRAPDELEWFPRLEAEQANLRSALAWMEVRGEAERLARLASALWWFWRTRGPLREG